LSTIKEKNLMSGAVIAGTLAFGGLIMALIAGSFYLDLRKMKALNLKKPEVGLPDIFALLSRMAADHRNDQEAFRRTWAKMHEWSVNSSVEATQALMPVILKGATETVQAIGKVQESAEDAVNILKSRLDSALETLSLIPEIINDAAKSRNAELMGVLAQIGPTEEASERRMAEVLGAIHEIKFPEVVAPAPDPKIQETLESINASTRVMMGEIRELKSLTSGITEVAKSLAQVAHGLERGGKNEYERYLEGQSSGAAAAKARRLAEDFDLSTEEAVQLVQGYKK
jgi:hypothetical protein